MTTYWCCADSEYFYCIRIRVSAFSSCEVTIALTARISPNEADPSLALRHINLKIESGGKVAICGRTGSGKSTLVALLLKLLDPLASPTQRITIDDVPLSRVNRAALRQRLIAVPQEAVFLPDGSTFQANLDSL